MSAMQRLSNLQAACRRWLHRQNPFHHRQIAASTTHTYTKHSCSDFTQLECGPMTNVMAVLPNIGGALRSTPQSLADAHY